MCDLQNHIRPYDMQAQHQNEETIENIVSWKHWKNSRCFNATAVDDSRIETQSSYNPYDGECSE